MTLLDAGRSGDRLSGIDVIDMHGHLGRCGFAIPEMSAARMVAVMDRIGVSAVLCSHMQSMGRDTARGNDEVLEAMRAYPNRILGYASAWPSSESEVAQEIERCLGAGFTGIKIHNSNGFPYTYPAYDRAYAIANERGLPVLFHCWGNDREFGEIAEIAQRFPRISALLAHGGCQNIEGYLRMARDHANVYLDLSFSAAPHGLVARLAAGAGVAKLVWGSDTHFLSQAQQIGKVLGANLPDEAKVRILSTNARAILDRIAL